MHCPQCDHDNLAGADLCENCGLDLAGLDEHAWGMDPDDPLLGVPLSRLPLKVAIVVSGDATVAHAIARMRELHEGCVFVVQDDRLIGVLTERDLCTRVAVPGRDPVLTRVDEVMTDRPVTLHVEDPLAWALHRMGVDGHRHLPVLDGERLVGFLSMRSVLRVLLDGAPGVA